MTDKKKIQEMEMRFLRRIKKKTRRDMVRNVSIQKNLKISSLNDKIESLQLRWFGQVCRMNEGRCLRRAWEAKREGRRGRGWSRTKWKDNIKKLSLIHI